MGGITDGWPVRISCDRVLVAVSLFADPLTKRDGVTSSANEDSHHGEPANYWVKEMNAYGIASGITKRLVFLRNDRVQKSPNTSVVN
jgi:hypothetical protein